MTVLKKIIYLILLTAVFLPLSAYTQFYPFKNPYYDITLGKEIKPQTESENIRKWFQYSGYLRFRGNLIYNFDLNRGTLPSTGEPIYPYSPVKSGTDEALMSGNMRFRFHPVLNLGQEIKIHSVLDLFDNLAMGSTPDSFPASYSNIEVAGSANQNPPVAGMNSISNSITVKKLWTEVYLPFGILMAGRMGMDWGLGMVANSGDGFDDDFDTAVDRIGIATSIFDHFIGLSYDFSATGPAYADSPVHGGEPMDLTETDDMNTISFAILKYYSEPVIGMYLNNEPVVLNYGAYISFRSQEYDVPSYYINGISASGEKFDSDDYVRRDSWAVAADFWLRMNMKRFRIETEFAYIHGKIGNSSMFPVIKDMPALTMDQYGGVVQLEFIPFTDSLSFLLESGLASGDSMYGFGAFSTLKNVNPQPGDIEGKQFDLKGDKSIDNFRFSQNFHVDEILWRRLIGTFTDGLYFKTGARIFVTDGFLVNPEIIYSRCLEANSAPGLANPLGIEFDLKLTYFSGNFFSMGAVYGFLYPLAGLRNVVLQLDPEPAQIARLFMAVLF